MSDDLSPAALHHEMAEDLRAGRVLWVRADGLGAADPAVHRGLQSALRRTGVHGELGGVAPETVVLDWTHLAAVSADGLAFAAVLLQALRDRGIHVRCCPPHDPVVGAALAQSSCGALRGEGIAWHAEPTGTVSRTDPRHVLGPLHLFAGARGFSLSTALDQIEGALNRAGWRSVPMLPELLMEIAQNIRSHANARHAALCVVVERRRRPPRLQVGVADDGIGIPNSILNDPRHGWLDSFSPARATETVVMRQLSGRGADQGGGVLGDLYETLLAESGATVTLRSGAGWVRISGADRESRHESLTYGLGTQVLVELPLLTA